MLMAATCERRSESASESSYRTVKIRAAWTENSSGKAFNTRRAAAKRLVPRPRVYERSSLPNSQKHPAAATVEPNRLRLILQRLQEKFYDGEPVSTRIAAAALADMKDLDESPPTLPH
jgi:hypothetical protein